MADRRCLRLSKGHTIRPAAEPGGLMSGWSLPALARASRLRRPSRDTFASAAGAATFSISLGIATVSLPLLALRSGYSPVEIGVLTAVSAIAQMATRLVLG